MRDKQLHINLILFLFSISLLMVTSCQNTTKSKKNVVGIVEKEHRDLTEILKENKLVILAENSATSYFIYKGQKMGLEYEILKRFAKDIGVQLEVVIIDDLDNIIDDLKAEKADVIACNYTITKERRKQIDFTIPYLHSSQVLIQRKPENWAEEKKKKWEEKLIREPSQLSRKTVYVWKNSSYYDRLINLQEELGDTIIIKPLDGNIIPEKAIEMVSKGFIDYTVVDENVAKINQRYYPDIDAELALSIKQRIGFGVRKESPLLRKRLDAWLTDFIKTPAFKYIKHKYLSTSTYSSRSRSEFSSISGSKISSFDPIIKEKAKKYGWDWRLIASLIYQESKFNLGLESWAGAYGLMQFMPAVGPSYNVFPDSSPEEQIDGGIRKLKKDYSAWKSIPDSIQRVKFALASYNAGAGHILDAQRLAKKYGKDPHIWDDNVEIYIRELSSPEYYRDPVVYYGYLRGIENYNYVRQIISRYNEYTMTFPE